ncbi:MAG: hypothetical protein GX119_10625 [Syntrophomonadaceae bacterium]|jgi:RNA processing factor Prp31|nr:hypothetical protein [Syntrophomonadaceae bacterium]
MSSINTIHNPNELSKVYNLPETISELYNLALELNQQISDSLIRVLPNLADNNQKAVKNLLYYQKMERNTLIELLHNELNNSYRAFYNHNKDFINVYKKKEEWDESSNWIKKSLDAFAEKTNNLEYLGQKNRNLSQVDFLILYLGLRDYCSNMFQQMSANYRMDRLSHGCQELVVLLDQLSDEIGEAYTAQK